MDYVYYIKGLVTSVAVSPESEYGDLYAGYFEKYQTTLYQIMYRGIIDSNVKKYL
jgi:hypothetical protein